ncbi:ester cyclase [Prescottella agglutinans]|uniref:Ester cyclase n=2 Tax=Prescottella agglutinans TaxID=1644129 RepID=A0A3S3ZZ73_9NOCA|nr:ester cyclase [Prescottella agglutinans]
MVSKSDAVAAEGRTTLEVTWELRAEPTDDGRCIVTDRIVVAPTGEYFAFLDRHGITFEDAAAACHTACNDHNRRETPLLAASIARRASSSNGRHAAGPVAAVTIRRAPSTTDGEAAKAVVRRNAEQVQGGGDFAVFDELFADDYVDHTPQPGTSPDKAGTRLLYQSLRAAFPDFHADIHWQSVDGDLVTTYKTYHGTHRGAFMGIAPTGRAVQFETVDAMRVRDGRIVEHWGVANRLSLMEQLG